MQFLDDISALEALYGTPGEAALSKVTNHLSPAYRRWIEASRFCVLASVGPEGTDASPRGDDGPVVAVLDARTLALPDWRGNQRLDSLRNIIRDGRISLTFLVSGSDTVMRVNGTARVTADKDLRARFARNGKSPATVIVVQIGEVYPQCARAVMRADLWNGARAQDLPSIGDMLREVRQGFDGATYDREWPARAAKSLWWAAHPCGWHDPLDRIGAAKPDLALILLP